MRIFQYEDYWQMDGDKFQPGDAIVAKVVCVLGHDNDYAIYVGYKEDMAAEDIAEYGDKIPLQDLFFTARYGKYERL